MIDRINAAMPDMSLLNLGYGAPMDLAEVVECQLTAARIQDTPLDWDMLWLEQSLLLYFKRF